MVHSYITGNSLYDKLVYSFIGIRVIAYLIFFIINSIQMYYEFIKIIKYHKTSHTKNKTASRCIVFLWLAIFSLLRLIQSLLFYANPNLGMGTANFFFFSLGTTAIFLTWVYITRYWLLIMYNYFILDEIRSKRSKPINYFTFIFSTVIIIYQIVVSCITLYKNIETAESIGFLILLLIYAGAVFIFGYSLIKHLKKFKKKTSLKSFNIMIFKTKILVGLISFVFITILVQEFIFNLYYTDTYETPRQYLKIFVVGLIEFIQMLIILLTLSDGNWKNYFLLRVTKINSNEGSNENENNSNNSSNSSNLGSNLNNNIIILTEIPNNEN